MGRLLPLPISHGFMRMSNPLDDLEKEKQDSIQKEIDEKTDALIKDLKDGK